MTSGPRYLGPGFKYDPSIHGWRVSAECRDTDYHIFFPDAIDMRGPGVTDLADKYERQAKTLCEVCPVEKECLEDALRTKESYGIRGGKNAAERRRILRKRGERLATLTGRSRRQWREQNDTES